MQACNKIILKMLQSIGFRSKSATEKKEDSSTKDLKSQFKAYLRLNLDHPIVTSQKNATKKLDKGQAASAQVERPSSQLPQSRQGLSKNPTAINQLQMLITPRVENRSKMFQKGARPIFKSSEGVEFGGTMDECPQNLKYAQETNRSASMNSIQYYRRQLIKVTNLLVNEEKKNSHLMLNICNLERQLHQSDTLKQKLQTEVQQLQQSHRSLQLRHSQLQNLSKQQMIINLQLEALLGKITIKHQRKTKEQDDMIDNLKKSYSQKKDRYCSKVKDMEIELKEAKHTNEEQIQRLQYQLNKKSAEVNRLKMKVKLFNEENEYIEMNGTSTIPSFNNLQSSRHDVEVKFSLQTKGTVQTPSLQTTQISPLLLDKLGENLYHTGKSQTRSLSKTDRI